MAGSIAHEINNPLSIILGYSQMLSKLKDEGRLTEDFISATCSKFIYHSDRIHLIVKGMSELDKKINLKDTSERFNPSCFIENLNFLYKDKNIVFKSLNEIDSRIKYPAKELSFALEQLVDNAVYFSSKNPKPAVEIEFHQLKDHYVFEVKDNGDGISGELAQSIYEPFFTTKKNSSGTGLGLSLAC